MSLDISIIIPVYNVEKYIHQCIESILCQKNVNFEIIAVDDGSPDGCGDILDKYAENDSRIHVIHQRNAGVSRARNAGITYATGKWCYFVDSDDWLSEGQLKLLLNLANQTDPDVVFVDCIEQYESGKTNRIRLFSREFVTDDKDTIQEIQNSILCHKKNPYFVPGADNAYPAPWSKLIRTKLIKDHNLSYDPYVCGVYDDGLFTLEVLQRATKIAYSHICIYNYRILTSSIVHAYRKDMVEKFEKNCRRVDEYIDKYQKGKDFKNAEYCRRIAYLSSFLSAYFFAEDNPLSVRDKKAALLETIRRDPWKIAIVNAKISLLEPKHIYTCICMRGEFLPGLRLYATLKKQKQKKSGR